MIGSTVRSARAFQDKEFGMVRVAQHTAAIRRWMMASVMCLLGAASACAQDDSALSQAEEQAVRDLIRAHLIENPEIIEEAILALQLKRQVEEQAAIRDQVAALSAEIYDDPRDISIGPADAPVRVVEFFDYNCGFCRRSADFVANLPQAYGDQVRVIFKEAPVLGEGSREAARWALAAKQADVYADAHFALMAAEERLDAQTAARVLREAGVPTRDIEPARSALDTSTQIDDTLALLGQISGGRSATPTFIVNDTVIMGADLPAITAAIEAALAPSAP